MRNRWTGATVAAALCACSPAAATPARRRHDRHRPGHLARPDREARRRQADDLGRAEQQHGAARRSSRASGRRPAPTVEVVTIPDPYEQGIQTKVATGDKPDLAFWQPTASMLTAINARTDLQPLDDAPWLERTDPDLRDITGLLDGTRYAALVTSPAVEGVYYNKEVLAAAGITTPPKNFDEMVAAGRTLKAAGVTPFYEMGGDRWATQWWVQVQLADAAQRRAVGPGEHRPGEVHRPDDPRRDQAVQGADRRGAVQHRHQDRRHSRTRARRCSPARPAMVVQVNSFFGQLQAKADTPELDQKIGFFPIAPVGQRRHVHPGPEQRARRVPHRRREARGGGPAAAELLAGPGLPGVRRRPADGLAAAGRVRPGRRPDGAARRPRRAAHVGRLDAGARRREPRPVHQPRRHDPGHHDPAAGRRTDPGAVRPARRAQGVPGSDPGRQESHFPVAG